MTNKTEDIGV